MTSTETPPPAIVCLGEVLWDCLPRMRVPGGAPLNVAFHLHRLGVRAHLVSVVGCDELGSELLKCLREWGLDVDGIRADPQFRTGVVQARILPSGEAHFEIATAVAWDWITFTPQTLRELSRARALVFGSLALRSRYNRLALDRAFSLLPQGAERVFDVNLRPPHDDLALVREVAPQVSFLKLNLDEAHRLVGTAASPNDRRGVESIEPLARIIAANTKVPSVCVTAGACGAGLLDNRRWWWETAKPVTVTDTIGAGDAFLAGLLAARFEGAAPAAQLARGCRLGEWVASHAGATAASETAH